MYTLTSPIPGTPRVTSPYGWRTIFGKSNFHRGNDVANPPAYGVALKSPDLPGVVTHVRYQRNGFGWYVYIKFDNGMGFARAHMLKPLVTPGQRVNKDTVLGLLGATGLATGPHSHDELHRKHGAGFTQSNAVNFKYSTREEQKMKDFYTLIKEQRPDVWSHFKGNRSSVDWWWREWGQYELRRALGNLKRGDIWEFERKNPGFDLKKWYVEWAPKEYPSKNIWRYM